MKDIFVNQLKSDIRDLKLSFLLGDNDIKFIPDLKKLRK
jgi:hypothetical protein